MFHALWAEGWFPQVVGTVEDRVTVTCDIFVTDYDDETGVKDILLVDTSQYSYVGYAWPSDGETSYMYVEQGEETDCPRCVVCGGGPGERRSSSGQTCPGECGNSLEGMALASRVIQQRIRYHCVLELREQGPAMLLHQPPLPSSGYKEMPRDMANAIAALITPANFPEAAAFMPVEPEEYPDDEDARNAFWASVNEQISSMRATGDPWGALRVQREAVDKLINWVDPPAEDDHEIPEPNLDDMVPLSYSLIEAADAEQENAEEYDYLPVGAHLLPPDFRAFLHTWNKSIAASTGDWMGEQRQTYRREHPELWQQFRSELKKFKALYPTELASLKAYQASSEGQEEIEDA